VGVGEDDEAELGGAPEDEVLAEAGQVDAAEAGGEEGLGDLRGAKELFNVTLKGKIDSFIWR
jgi:hypothetical protein